MNFDDPGPSGIKRRKKKEFVYKAPLTDSELERILLDSDGDLAHPDYTDSEFDVTSDSDIDEVDVPVETDTDLDTTPLPIPVQTDQPTTSSDEPVKWTQNASKRTVPFPGKQELKTLPNGNRPMDYFNLLVDDSFFELIVQETNRYAVDVFQSENVGEYWRITRCCDTTVPEMRLFFGLFLHMGTIQLNRMQDYWKRGRLFNIPLFSTQMSRDRFMIIMRCLHFAENPKPGDPKPEDRLFKIRPLINYFNNKMMSTYSPNKNLSLDESMILWRGRLIFRQYIKNKRHKSGIKLYILTEPHGTILKFTVYTGTLDDFGGKGHAANVVLHLMEEKLDAGHSLFMDNYYNSYHLAQKLLNRGTYCTGTLGLDWKDNPEQVKNAKLRVGDNIACYSNDVMVGKWRDKRDVSYISTEFSHNFFEYRNKRGQEKKKPDVIYMYNKNMGGVDKQDQMLSYYPCSRKTLRWYKKLATHILQMMLNSYFLYKKYEKSRISFYDFRLRVIEELVPPKEEAPPLRPIQMQHIPEKNPIPPNAKARPRRRCRACYTKNIRKDTIYFCPARSSQPALCLDGTCFSEFHEGL